MKRVFNTFLLSILLVMILGTVAHAEKYVDKYAYKAIATKQNTWYKPKSENETYSYSEKNDVFTTTYTYYRYKFTVPANYYMTLTIKGSNYTSLEIYKALKAKNDNDYCGSYDHSNSSAKTFNIALPKGTYYFCSDYNFGKLAFKYRLYKYVNKPNYKSTKALNWKANKKLAIVQMPGHNYERWYKIKLTKKKRIYIWGANDVDLYDAKRQPLQVSSNNNSDSYTYYSYNKLKAGIFYIRVLGARPYYEYPWYGSVEIVWWK